MGKEADKVTEAIQRKVDKTKKKLKKICCCGFGWATFGLVSVIVGIVLLVFYAKFWPTDKWQRGLGYTGLALLLVGLVLLAIGIAFWAALYIFYRRTQRGQQPMHNPIPKFEYGKAPYPQQPPPGQAVSPQQPSAPATDQTDVHVDVSDHHKF